MSGGSSVHPRACQLVPAACPLFTCLNSGLLYPCRACVIVCSCSFLVEAACQHLFASPSCVCSAVCNFYVPHVHTACMCLHVISKPCRRQQHPAAAAAAAAAGYTCCWQTEAHSLWVTMSASSCTWQAVTSWYGAFLHVLGNGSAADTCTLLETKWSGS